MNCVHGLPLLTQDEWKRETRLAIRQKRAVNGCRECYWGPAKPNPSAATSPGRLSLPVLPPPCFHLGPVVAPCSRCGNQEARNLHSCNHPDVPWDTCRRGETTVTEETQSCLSCPHYTERGDVPAAHES